MPSSDKMLLVPGLLPTSLSADKAQKDYATFFFFFLEKKVLKILVERKGNLT